MRTNCCSDSKNINKFVFSYSFFSVATDWPEWYALNWSLGYNRKCDEIISCSKIVNWLECFQFVCCWTLNKSSRIINGLTNEWTNYFVTHMARWANYVFASLHRLDFWWKKDANEHLCTLFWSVVSGGWCSWYLWNSKWYEIGLWRGESVMIYYTTNL